jgi:hypothetical protein
MREERSYIHEPYTNTLGRWYLVRQVVSLLLVAAMNNYQWKGVGGNKDDAPKERVSRRRVKWPTRSAPSMQGGMALERSLFLPDVFRNGREVDNGPHHERIIELSTSQMNALRKVLTCLYIEVSARMNPSLI